MSHNGVRMRGAVRTCSLLSILVMLNAAGAAAERIAAPNPFVGKWTLNIARSIPGPGGLPWNGRRTYEDRGDGVIVGRREGISADGQRFLNYYAVKFDGKYYPCVVLGTSGVVEIAFTMVNPRTSAWTMRQDEKVTVTGRSEVSSDGKVLTVTAIAVDGTRSVEVYDRQ